MDTLRFYCPLKAGTYDDPMNAEYGRTNELSEVDPWDYEDEIREAVAKENLRDGERGLSAYLDAPLCNKVTSIIPAVEAVGDNLYGVFEAELAENLSPEEVENLRHWLSGQASDGWGESVEQHPIDTADGEIYVSFWHTALGTGGDYFMLTQDEFDVRIGIERNDPEVMSVYQKFEKKLLNNYTDYISECLSKSPSELIEDAENIAMVKHTYDNLQCGIDCGFTEYLMRFENPLELVSEQYAAELEITGEASIDNILYSLLCKPDLARDYAIDADYAQTDQSQGMSI
jgi:hypothetical protein